MAHHSRLFATVVDVPEPDHDRELEFWQAAAGRPLRQYPEHPEYHVGRWPGLDVRLLVQRLGDGPAHIHLDIATDDVPAEVERLVRLGAEPVSKTQYWQVLRDPAGLVFCVVTARPGALTDDNSQRWD
jgi:Glyoxalase-like domain